MTTILFPHQLFKEALTEHSPILLVEHPLFFRQLPFHTQKLIFHHVSIRAFQDLAISLGCPCEIITLETLDTTSLLKYIAMQNLTEIRFYEPRDDYLSKEIRDIAKQVAVTVTPSPSFLTPLHEWMVWQEKKQALRMQDFYKWQRMRLTILMENDLPTGGKWSFDSENRSSIPAGTIVPVSEPPTYSQQERAYITEATKRFATQPGSSAFNYPVTHAQALNALDNFITTKLRQFGDYEDAVSTNHSVLFHSQLSPLLNSGLLTPHQVLTAVLDYAQTTEIPLNSLEGFMRQLIGWREFMSLTYLTHGKYMRTSNVLNHKNPLPTCFWKGKTGLLPIDHTVNLVLETGYAHHIERLMILGVFMLLTETEPTEAFNWFYAMFIDAYDWVMVPNVYAMSQYAPGGLLTTKPYICGSAYLRKMTNFPTGEWCAVWDGLYWRWVSTHQPLLQKNPRTSMSVAMWNKFSSQKQEQLLTAADVFLTSYYA